MKGLEINNLSFSYTTDSGPIPIINDLSLSIPTGEFLTLLGPSGCGKTTLLRLMAGFLRRDGGSISYNQNPVTRPFPQGQMIFQDFSQLLPWLTIEKNILFPRYRNHFFQKPKIEETDSIQLNRLLEKTGLLEKRYHYPHQLSGGLKQKAALARALFAEAEILFMDEPFSSLDAPNRSDLQNLLIKLREEDKKIIVFVTHNISEALYLSDSLLVFPGSGEQPVSLKNSLPRPRDKKSPKFNDEKFKLYSLIESGELTL